MFLVLTFTIITSTFLSTIVSADKKIDIESRTIIYEKQEVLNKFLKDSSQNLIRLKFDIPNVEDSVEIFIFPEENQDIDFNDEKDLYKLAIRFLKAKIKTPELSIPTPEKFSYWIEIPNELI